VVFGGARRSHPRIFIRPPKGEGQDL